MQIRGAAISITFRPRENLFPDLFRDGFPFPDSLRRHRPTTRKVHKPVAASRTPPYPFLVYPLSSSVFLCYSSSILSLSLSLSLLFLVPRLLSPFYRYRYCSSITERGVTCTSPKPTFREVASASRVSRAAPKDLRGSDSSRNFGVRRERWPAFLLASRVVVLVRGGKDAT